MVLCNMFSLFITYQKGASMKSVLLLAFLSLVILFHPTELQAQWQLRGLNGQNVHSLYANGNLTYAGTQTSGFYISTDNGVSWTQQNNGLTNSHVKTFALSGSNLFAGTNGPAGVYLTTNNGGNWVIVNSGISNTSIHALEFNGTILLAGSNGGGVFQSTDNGATWLASINGLSNLAVHALLVAGNRVFAGTDGGVFLSTNNGANWSLPATSPGNLRSLATRGSDIFAAANGTGVFKSTDNGDTWFAANGGLTNTSVRVIISSGINLFAGTNGGGVYLSTNSGTSWSQINAGLDSLSILSLTSNSTTLYAGAQTGGVWTRPLSQVVAVDESGPATPTSFSLKQNYPNPFNPTTTLSFAIPSSSFVTLKVFDVLGREVATLVNETKAAGIHFVDWNAVGHPSGLYFYRLSANGITELKKMMLLK
jgi:photosystem II stability/assembly factor-like uncharacterized protein